MTTASPPKLVAHFFRHEYGRLVALLTKRFGLRHLDAVEDAVQSALVAALQSWRTRGVPDDAAAWIYRAARNRVLDALRRAKVAQRLTPAVVADRSGHDDSDAVLDSEIEDSQLRLMFACGHPSLAPEARVALTLKTLCGFSTAEIARGLLITEENAKKRITRAKHHLMDQAVTLEVPPVTLEVPPADQLPERLETVHAVLYLLFNEGYQATELDQPIRRDLCDEAARLCHLLCLHPHCSTPATWALLALMLFHAARFDARLDRSGCLLLAEEQDRSRWDGALIRKGLACLARSAQGQDVTCYHLEAGIAMYHCKASSFAATDWRAILAHYDMLVRLQPSPIYLLNRAIALAQVEGPQAGIRAVAQIRAHPQLQNYHLLDATLGELHRRAGDLTQARDYFHAAWRKTRSRADRQLLERRLAMCKARVD